MKTGANESKINKNSVRRFSIRTGKKYLFVLLIVSFSAIFVCFKSLNNGKNNSANKGRECIINDSIFSLYCNEYVNPDWLLKQLTYGEADSLRKFMIDPPSFIFSGPALLTRYDIEGWDCLSNYMQGNDELWSYVSPSKSWMGLYGRYGIALVRNKKILGGIKIAMN